MVSRVRTEAEDNVGDLLRTAREALGVTLSFLTRMDGPLQRLELVESLQPSVVEEGQTVPRSTSPCQAALDGRLEAVVPDLGVDPVAMNLPVAQIPGIRSFASVPVVLSDGTLYGTFCAIGFVDDQQLTMRDRALMDVLARAASALIEPELIESARRTEILGRLEAVRAAGGPDIVLQPVVDLGSGRRVGAEALSRFPATWGLPPDECFAQAHSVDQGNEMERLALRCAIGLLDAVTGYVAMNVSPRTLMTPECLELFASVRAPERVLLELSEHEPVTDYEKLTRALAPLRAGGMRLAIDDVGAGFSSLRHIVLTAPEVIKLDRSIVAGVATDPVLQTLVGSLVKFAHGCHAGVVAEGIETADDAASLSELGVDFGQGWHFGRPGPVEALTGDIPRPRRRRRSPDPAAEAAVSGR